MLSFLRSPQFVLFTAVVAAQGALGFYLNSRKEYVPEIRPLNSLPASVGGWTMTREFPVDPEVQAVLKADDVLSRHYVKPGVPQGGYLYLNFFKSQRTGVAPHSPKNCLPGNGWVADKNETIQIAIPGRADPIQAQYYLIQRGDLKSIVIYWYQSHSRVVASEYVAKYYVIADAIRLNRTDTSLVKFTVAVGPEGVEKARENAIEMVRDFFGPVSAVLPG